MKNKNFNLLLVIFTLFLIIFLSVGYSAFSSNLNISGEAVYRVEKDVRITNLSLNSTSYEGLSSYSKFGYDNINVGNTLKNINSTVTYNVEISNKGNIPVILKSITPNYGENNNITYIANDVNVGSYVIEPDALKEGEQIGKPTIITITIKYKDGLNSVPSNIDANMILKFEFIKAESILAKGNTESNMLFNKNLSEIGSSLTKANVRTVILKPFSQMANEVDSTTNVSWDASLNKDGTVIAYFKKINSVSNYYQLTLYGYGQIKLPDDSSNLFYGCTVLTQITQNIKFNSDNVINMSYMFYNCDSLIALDLSSFNTSKVLDMSYMFYNCASLIGDFADSSQFNLKSFDFSNVLNTSYMFYKCSSIKNILFDNKKTNNASLTDMKYMFYGCNALTELDLSCFNTLNVTDMKYMFYNCDGLLTLNIKNFNADNVVDTSYMFYHCISLTNLNLDNFNASKVTNMKEMFMYCNSLVSLDLSSFTTSNVTDMYKLFYNCKSLVQLTLGKNFNASNVEDMGYMFYNCASLTSLDLSNFLMNQESKVTTMVNMFQSCSNLKNINFGNQFYAKNVTNMSMMFSNCASLQQLNLDIITSEKLTLINNLFEGCTGLSNIVFGSEFNTSKVSNFSRLFYNCVNLGKNNTINLGINTSSATNLSYMFYNCSSLSNVTFDSLFDTAKVTDFSSMFYGCSLLKELDISFNFTRASNIKWMFKNCSGLVNLTLKNIKTTTSSIDASNMFENCTSLKKLDLSEFHSTITAPANMFLNCSSLIGVDLSKIKLSSASNFSSMFSGCTSLVSLDLSGNYMKSGTVFENMFYGCSSLTSVNLSNASNDKVSNTKNMFYGCIKLTNIDIRSMKFKYSLVSSSRADISGMFTNVPSLATIYVSNSSNDKGSSIKSGESYLSGDFNFVAV